MDELTLPPLPEFPEGTVEVDCGPLTGGGRAISIEDGYSADQMRAYAQQAASAAVLQERDKWEQDAMRYRWLAGSTIVPQPSLWDRGVGFACDIFTEPRASGAFSKAQLDAAIDAAIRTAKEGA